MTRAGTTRAAMADMAAPRLVVDIESGIAPWRQVRDQLVQLIGSGRLPTGSRLPTIRQLATDLGLAPGTVARAYRELEAGGVLHTARRRGTVVADAGLGPDQDPLRVLAGTYVSRARALGADLETAVAAVRDAFRETADDYRNPSAGGAVVPVSETEN